MPLTPKGQEIEKAMRKEYGDKKGERVFNASRNKGTISGVESGTGDAVMAGSNSSGPALTGESLDARKAKVAEAAKQFFGNR